MLSQFNQTVHIALDQGNLPMNLFNARSMPLLKSLRVDCENTKSPESLSQLGEQNSNLFKQTHSFHRDQMAK